MKNKKGFTLVELLVVIAIIGILSSVAVVNLNSARDKARRASALASLSGLSPVIQVCLDSGYYINNTMVNAGGGGTDICPQDTAITTNWPNIRQFGFNYNNATITSNPSTGVWHFYSGNKNTVGAGINCTQTGCS